MLNFKNIEIDDVQILNRFLKDNNELSCENTFTNLLIWQKAYSNMYAIYDGFLFIKSGTGQYETYSLPFGEDLIKGIKIIKQHCKNKKPSFWVQEGDRLDLFLEHYGDDYTVSEVRENFDYIYLQEDLSSLSGKKYHSKRNHISTFSKKYDWHYETVNQSNIKDIKKCYKKWYAENSYRTDSEMLFEEKGVTTLTDNMEKLGVIGGAIYVNGEVVAFSLGVPINDNVFDIQIEKALKDYLGAYPIINREFVKNELSNYRLINREDDLGIEGLRKSKLSYKPHMLLKKFILNPKEN